MRAARRTTVSRVSRRAQLAQCQSAWARTLYAFDGRQPVAAHGSSEMPVWGEIFSDQKASAQPDALIRGQVQLLTEYLASIQVR
jgi:hypothetical protein